MRINNRLTLAAGASGESAWLARTACWDAHFAWTLVLDVASLPFQLPAPLLAVTLRHSGLAVAAVERLKAAKRAATLTFGVDGSKIVMIMVSSMAGPGLAGFDHGPT